MRIIIEHIYLMGKVVYELYEQFVHCLITTAQTLCTDTPFPFPPLPPPSLCLSTGMSSPLYPFLAKQMPNAQ